MTSPAAQLDDLQSKGAAQLVDLVAEAAVLGRSDSAAASLRLSQLQDEAERRQATDLIAQCAYARARAELDLGHSRTALSLIDTARLVWLTAGHPLRAARTDLGRIAVLNDLGRHDDAVRIANDLLGMVETVLEDDEEQTLWVRAGAYENLGVCQGYLGRHEAALASHTAAESIYRELGCEDEMVHPQANRGVETLELGDAAAAIVYLRAAALAFDRQGDQLFMAKCLAYEARAQLQLGNYIGCKVATDRGEELLEGQETTTEYARIQLVRADTLTSMNLLAAAERLYERLVAQFGAEGFHHDEAAAEAGKAVVLARLGRPEAGRVAIRRARQLFREVGDQDRAAFADVVLSELVDDEEAGRLVTAALPVVRRGARPAQLVTTLLRSAELEPDDQRALDLLDEASGILDENDLPHLAWRQLHERALRLRQAGELENAAGALAAARERVESIRATLDRDVERLPFMANREQVFVDSIALQLDLGEVEAAHAIAERSRSRTLVEVMTGSVRQVRLAVPSELDQLYDELLGAAPRQAIDVRASAHDLELDAAVAASVGPAVLPAPGFSPIDPYRSFGAVVTYQILGDEVVAFVHHRESLRVVRNLIDLGALSGLHGRLDAQWRRFADPSLTARHQGTLLRTALDLLQRLHIALVAPLEVLDAASLLVVPHGPLANLPFGAFHDGICHLIERMPVTMAPSAAAASFAQSSLRNGNRVLAVGVPTAATPYVADEIDAIATGAEVDALLGDEATVDRVLGELPDFDILHLASHGLSRPDNPLFSAVQFGDRWLTAGEIAGLELDGQLVVLSACASGMQHGTSELSEMNGLPRAFLAAGAGAVVVNLWPVEDRASNQLMRRFHRHLRHQSAAQALRAAQQEQLLETPHPYRWAPSVVIGAPTEMRHP